MRYRRASPPERFECPIIIDRTLADYFRSQLHTALCNFRAHVMEACRNVVRNHYNLFGDDVSVMATRLLNEDAFCCPDLEDVSKMLHCRLSRPMLISAYR